MKAIHPYRNGPWIILHLPDVYVSVIGQTCRQGMLEVMWLLSNMWLIMPWYKYYMNCNPWLDDLDHRFVNQISATCADINASDPTRSSKIGREIISRAKTLPGPCSEGGSLALRAALPVPTAWAALCHGYATGRKWLQELHVDGAHNTCKPCRWQLHGAACGIELLQSARLSRHAVVQQSVPPFHWLGGGSPIYRRSIATGQGRWRRASHVASGVQIPFDLKSAPA